MDRQTGEVFDTFAKAYEYAKDNYDYEFCDTYCDILGYYYIDIFEKSIED